MPIDHKDMAQPMGASDPADNGDIPAAATRSHARHGLRVPSDHVPRVQPHQPHTADLEVDIELVDSEASQPAVTPVTIHPKPSGLPADPVESKESEEAEELLATELEEVEPSVAPVPSSPPPAPRPSVETSAPSASPTPRPPPPKPPQPHASQAARVAAEAAANKAQNLDDTPRPKRRKAKAWWEEVFDDDYLRTLPFLTPQATQREALFVADALGLKPGQQVLDVGCGYGRHAMELAARGYHVVALDLSLPLLIRGADEAQRRGLSINFVHGDMRELSFDAQFDGVYCVFSTFGYFDDDTNKRVAAHLCRALKPGGRLVLDALNRDYIVADLPTRVWWEGDGCVVLEEVDFNFFASRLVSSRSVVFEDGRQLEQEISLRVYSLHELGKMLHHAGFRVLEVSGNLATRGRFFGSDSRHVIIVAERRTEPSTDPAAAELAPGT